jgi:hypothetical protein
MEPCVILCISHFMSCTIKTYLITQYNKLYVLLFCTLHSLCHPPSKFVLLNTQIIYMFYYFTQCVVHVLHHQNLS